MNEKHPLGDLMSTTMDKIREMVDVNEIVGQPICTQDGITIIPISKVSYGFASGGSDFQGKNAGQANPFGGGTGAGVKISPVAFIVVKDGSVRIMNIQPPASNTVDRLVDMAPDLIDKVTAAISKIGQKSDAADKAPEADVVEEVLP